MRVRFRPYRDHQCGGRPRVAVVPRTAADIGGPWPGLFIRLLFVDGVDRGLVVS